MTSNQIIFFCFLSVIAIILVSAFLVKIYRKNMARNWAHEHQKPRKIDIGLKCDIFELGKLAIILEDLVRYHIPVKIILDLNLMIEEVFTGIVSRRKEDQPDDKVLITLMLESGRITVFIKDRNEEFNPTVIPAIDLNAPLEEISFQGLGFHMVRHMADHVSYQRLHDQNILTLTKTYAT